MSDDLKLIKKKIAQDWQQEFPDLITYAQNKFYKIIGPLVVGIELINIQGIAGYRPHMVIYSLWGNKMGNDVKACLEAPAILMEIKNKKGFQFDIPYIRHSVYVAEAVECTRDQVPIHFQTDITLEELFVLVNGRFNNVLVKTHAAQQAKLYEFKFHAALYTGSLLHVDQVLKQIQQEAPGWNKQQFEMAYHNFDTWKQGLLEKINNNESFMTTIEKNKNDKQLGKLKRSVLKP